MIIVFMTGVAILKRKIYKDLKDNMILAIRFRFSEKKVSPGKK